MTNDEHIKLQLDIRQVELLNKKTIQETLFLEKKNATYMITIILAAIAVGIGFAKLVL